MHERIFLCLLTLSLGYLQLIAACVGEPQQHVCVEKQKAFVLLLLSHCSCQYYIFLYFHPAAMFANRSHHATYKFPLPHPCLNYHPPSKCWWGSTEEAKGDLKAPATHSLSCPPHPSSPSSHRLQQVSVSWLLSRVCCCDGEGHGCV